MACADPPAAVSAPILQTTGERGALNAGSASGALDVGGESGAVWAAGAANAPAEKKRGAVTLIVAVAAAVVVATDVVAVRGRANCWLSHISWSVVPSILVAVVNCVDF